ISRSRLLPFFFFLMDTPPPEIYTLSLHDALPISCSQEWIAHLLDDHCRSPRMGGTATAGDFRQPAPGRRGAARPCTRHFPQPSRSEEHTSELQSRENLVCRLLLEKKKTTETTTTT